MQAKSNYTKIAIAFVCVLSIILGVIGICAMDIRAEEAENYITFSNNSSFSLKTNNSGKNWDGTIYYSKNLSKWYVWDGTEISSSGGKLYLRGVGNTYITGGKDAGYSSRMNAKFVLSGGDVYCTGNIENLLDYETVAAGNHPEMGEYAFSYLFYISKNILSAPELPATTLSEYCYENMFTSCSKLQTLPELPATSLANGCYSGMFQSCSNIKISETQSSGYTREWKIPECETSSISWNSNMFASTGGTFKNNPVIGKTYYVYETPKNVSEYITFSNSGIFSLSTANSQKNWDGALYYSLDGVTWFEWSGTANITSGAANKIYLCGLGNTVISGNSYNKRFVLTSSASITCSGNMEALLDYKTVENGEHPAMGDYAFANLFKGSYGIVSVEGLELPATSLSVGCYAGIFSSCTNIKSAPELPATQLAANCYDSMFSGCSALESAPALPATVLADACYSGMFRSCGNLLGLPALPATQLAPNCYNGMFGSCVGVKLSETKEGNYTEEWKIPAEAVSATDFGKNMFSLTSGTFTGAPEIGKTYYVAKPHTHGGVEYDVALNEGDTLGDISQSTNIFLGADITQGESLTISGAGTVVNLCLNGHTLDMGVNIITVSGATLNICDCAENGKIYGYADSVHGIVIVDGGGRLNIESGTITSLDGYCIDNESGTVTIYGGSFINTTGYVIFNGENGTLYLRGGSVIGSIYGVCNCGTFYLTGTPLVYGERADVMLIAGFGIDAKSSDGLRSYSGGDIRIEVGMLPFNTTVKVVKNVTNANKSKFSVINSEGELEESGSNLVLQINHIHTSEGLCSCGGVMINDKNFPDNNFRNYLTGLDGDSDGFFNAYEISELTSIDVQGKGIESLDGIEFFTELTDLYCAENSLTALDISQNINLIVLDCSENELTELDVSTALWLTVLECGNNKLTTLDLTKNILLSWLYCNNNELTELDVSQNTDLGILCCEYNQISYLDVTQNIKLTEFRCDGNRLTSLDLSNNPEIWAYSAEGQQVSITISPDLTFDMSALDSLFEGEKATFSTANCLPEGNVLRVDIDTDKVQYTYATGLSGKTLSVTLTISNPHTHAALPDDGDCTTAILCQCGHIMTEAENSHADANNDGICDNCGKLVSCVISRVSVTLDGDIGVNFYWLLSDGVKNDDTAYFLLTLPNGVTERIMVSEAHKGTPVGDTSGREYYKITGRAAAKEMAEKIKVELFAGDVCVQSGECSVRDYAERVFACAEADAELVAMMKHMLNYGAASQIIFSHNTSDLANSVLEEGDKTVAAVETSQVLPARIEGGVDGIRNEEFSCILETKTTLRHYFSVAEGSVRDYVFSVDDALITPVETVRNGKTVYYVDIPDISAKDMDAEYVFVVKNSEQEQIIHASVHSYMNSVIRYSDDTALINAINAMYAYNQAAEAYFSE